MRSVFSIFILASMIAAAYYFAAPAKTSETIVPKSSEVCAADGDSFAIGARKFRLQGIDAPELKQTCLDESGHIWQCGAAAHGALITLLAQPGLICEAQVRDRYNRSLASCATTGTADIGAAQVLAGMAISNEFNGVRDYSSEEDEAKAAKRGIWRGSFTGPKEWRGSHKHTAPETKPIS